MKYWVGESIIDNSLGFYIEETLDFCKNKIEITEQQYNEFVNKQSQGGILKIDERGNPYVEMVEPSLEELKANKKVEINQSRDNAEQGGFEYMGKTFDSDPIACQRISCATQAMNLTPKSGAKITWTTQDNSTIELTAEQLAGLVGALAQHSNACHQKATKLKADVDKAKTAEEVEAIKWEN